MLNLTSLLTRYSTAPTKPKRKNAVGTHCRCGSALDWKPHEQKRSKCRACHCAEMAEWRRKAR